MADKKSNEPRRENGRIPTYQTAYHGAKKKDPLTNLARIIVEKFDKRRVPENTIDTIPFDQIYPDGLCRIGDNFYSKMVQFYDINYQLAQNDEKQHIFAEYCQFLNYFDETIHFQFCFINQRVDMEEYKKVISIPDQDDEFNVVRREYATYLRNQLEKGNNGIVKSKYLVFGIEARDRKQAVSRLAKIESDVINKFKLLGCKCVPVNGLERLRIMHDYLNQDSLEKFAMKSFKDVVESGLTPKNFITPTSFDFRAKDYYKIGDMFATTNFLVISAPEISDEMLADMAEIEKTAENARLANEAKTRFLFNMSHDIRTPMNAIIGFAQLLKDHADDKDKVNEYTSKISASGSVLLSIINQVLEMARIESGEAELNEEVGNLRELTESIKAVFEPEISRKKLSCDYLVKVTEEFVSYDETKVREILLNIIGNSVKYTPDGGNISVRVEQISKGDQGSASYRFTVADTGIGMSEEYLPHIFEEFTRERTSTETRVEGTGLGLPIVKSLVDMMGGSIDVQSKVGVGTTTTIVLTFAVATNTEVLTSMDQSWENIADRLCGMRILMAEDNDLNAELAVTLLGERGILVDRAVDGVQCIEMLRSRPSDYYIAVLMDIQMPNMDGYQATEIIRGLGDARAKIPVIAMTANAFDEDKKKAFSAGMNGHVVKPVDLERIFTVLGDVLEVGKEIKN